MMPKGVSAHVAIEFVDRHAYPQEWPSMPGCANDARSMRLLSSDRGFEPLPLLLNASATRLAVKNTIADAAKRLERGDVFLLTFSGHGAEVDGGDDEDRDQTWVLFDGQLLDDCLNKAWGLFKPGVRVVVVSDSCHSGSILDARGEGKASRHAGTTETKSIPRRLQDAYVDVHRAELKRMKDDCGAAAPSACVIQLGACQDAQETDPPPTPETNSPFTAALIEVFESHGGHVAGGYPAYVDLITRQLHKPQQQASFLQIGVPDPTFVSGDPFRV